MKYIHKSIHTIYPNPCIQFILHNLFVKRNLTGRNDFIIRTAIQNVFSKSTDCLEAYLQSSAKSVIELICENDWQLKALNYFRKNYIIGSKFASIVDHLKSRKVFHFFFGNTDVIQ